MLVKILLLSWNFPPTLGGIEYVADHLCRGFISSGHDVRVLTTQSAEAKTDDYIYRARCSGVTAFLRFAFFRGFRFCREWKPDILLCGSVVAAPAAYLLSRGFGIPYMVLVHGSDVLHKGWLYQRVVRRLFRCADKLTANSHYTKRLLEEAGIAKRKIVVIHPGVNLKLSKHEPGQESDDLIHAVGERLILLSVGRLVRRKGLLEFVENVMSRLIKAKPEVLFLLVGDDATKSLVHTEGMRDKIKAAIDRHGLKDHVRLLGTLPDADVTRLFSRADIFVLPGLAIPGDVEGFGIVFLEAALARTPAVATRVGGIPDAVSDQRTGLLTEPGDHEEMLHALIRLLEDERLRHTLADQGARRAREEFSWEVITANYLRVIEATIGMST